MAAASTSTEQRAWTGRLRRALPAAAQVLGAAIACGLWTGVASPGLQLLPGLDGIADESVAISLQSAVLGIDDGSGRPAEERARAAAAVLGLNYAESLLSPAAFRAGAAARGDGTPTASVVGLRPVAAQLDSSSSSPSSTSAQAAAGPVLVASRPDVTPASAAPTDQPPASEPAAPAPEGPTPAPPSPAPVATPAAPATTPLSLQTIALGVPASAVVGATHTVSAAASSGLPVKLSVAGSKDVCRIAGSTVSFREAGVCSIEAFQPGSVKFKEARAQESIAVVRAAQSISFASSPPSPAVAGGTYAVAVVASSGLPVSLSAGAGSGGVCKVSGTTVSLTGAGTCTVDADQSGDTAYLRAPRVQQSFVVVEPLPAVPVAQTLSFTSTPPASAYVGGPTYTVAALASSGLPVTFSVTAGSTGVCTVSGTVVALLGAGTCTVAADQSGGGGYLAAPRVLQSFAVVRTAQTIVFTSSAPSSAVYGDPAYSVAAVAASGLAVTFSIAPGSAGVCTVSGSTVAIVGAGTCAVRADQAGSAAYDPAPQAQQSFAVGQASQSVSFSSTPPAAAVYGAPAYTVAATATSGLAATFSIAPGSAGVCSVSGSTVSIVGVGTCTIRADQAGNANYLAAPQEQQSFAVAQAPQTISFTSTPPVVDGSVFAYNAAATATSGLAVTFSTPSAGVCSVFGAWVFFYGNGLCVVRADQAGNASYLAAPQAQQSIVVTGH